MAVQADPKAANNKANKAQEKVDEVRLIMEDNVKKMINNQNDFHDLEGKSANIKEKAYEMKQNAKALEREARKRNCRLKLLLACLAVSVLLYIIVPIAVDMSS